MTKNSTAEASARRLRALLDELVQADVALFTQPVSVVGGDVTWRHFPDAGPVLLHRHATQASDYLHWLRAGHYSAILNDGSLLQLSQKYVGNVLASQRFVYVPCPAQVPTDLLLSESVDEMVELHLPDSVAAVMQSDIRFDFDLEAATEDHPAAHLTFNRPSCRIPCFAPLRFGDFVDFVFRNFYTPSWTAHSFLRSVPGYRLPATIEPVQQQQLHLAWR